MFTAVSAMKLKSHIGLTLLELAKIETDYLQLCHMYRMLLAIEKKEKQYCTFCNSLGHRVGMCGMHFKMKSEAKGSPSVVNRVSSAYSKRRQEARVNRRDKKDGLIY